MPSHTPAEKMKQKQASRPSGAVKTGTGKVFQQNTMPVKVNAPERTQNMVVKPNAQRN